MPSALYINLTVWENGFIIIIVTKEMITVALTVMTERWKRIADDILVFTIRQRQKDENAFLAMCEKPIDVFNAWAYERGTAIEDAELALWCLTYIKDLAKMPLRRLIRAAEIDGLKY